MKLTGECHVFHLDRSAKSYRQQCQIIWIKPPPQQQQQQKQNKQKTETKQKQTKQKWSESNTAWKECYLRSNIIQQGLEPTQANFESHAL